MLITKDLNTMTDREYKTLENRVRRNLAKQGLLLHKSRAARSIDNYGGYMVIDAHYNWVVGGFRYDLGLDDIASGWCE